METPLSSTMLWPPPLAEAILEPIYSRLEQKDELDSMVLLNSIIYICYNKFIY